MGAFLREMMENALCTASAKSHTQNRDENGHSIPKTKSVAPRYANLDFPTCGMCKKFGEDPGDLDAVCLQLTVPAAPEGC